jgi:outer membrane biosynthesis protein TonB
MKKELLASLLQIALIASGLALAASPLYAASTPATAKSPSVIPHLEMQKAYPAMKVSEIGKLGPMPEDQAVVSFHVGRDGHFENIQLLRTSGVPALDRQTVRSVAQAHCRECAGHDYTVAYLYKTE